MALQFAALDLIEQVSAAPKHLKRNACAILRKSNLPNARIAAETLATFPIE